MQYGLSYNKFYEYYVNHMTEILRTYYYKRGVDNFLSIEFLYNDIMLETVASSEIGPDLVVCFDAKEILNSDQFY